MNRSLPSMVAGALLALVLGLYMVAFQVGETQVAVVRTFGKITPPDPKTGESPDVITRPGLYWKWPWPVQQVTTYDNRLQVSETTGEETPTQDGKPVIVTTAVGWRIDDPYTFSIRCTEIKDAENKLKTRVRNDQKTVIGRYDFAQFVSTDEKELRYDEIEQAILKTVRDSAKALYGLRVESVGIKKLALPQRITETVFDAMKKERQAEAARYTTEGESRAAQIKATADGIAETILSFADRTAAKIEAEGQGRAARYNEVFRQDENLAQFLLRIKNIPKIFSDRTTFVFDQDSSLFRMLFETPEGRATPSVTTAPAGERGGIEAAGPGDEITPPDMVGLKK